MLCRFTNIDVSCWSRPWWLLLVVTTVVPLNVSESIACCSSVVIAEPKPVQEPSEDVGSLLAQGRYRETLERLDSQPSTDSEAGVRQQLLRSRALIGLGQYRQAQEVLESLGELTDASEKAEQVAALARIAEARGQLDQAEALMEQAVSARRKSLASTETIEEANALAVELTAQGDMAFRTGRLDQARDHFREAINLVNRAHMKLHELGIPHNENDPRLFAGAATAGLARVYASSGDDRRGERTWRNIAARTTDPSDLLDLAAFYQARRDDRASKRVLARIPGLAEGKPQHRRVLAMFLAEHRDDLDGALTLAEAAYQDGPNIHARDTFAWVLYRRDEASRAAEILAEAIQIGTQDPTILYHAGMIDLALGREDQARRLLQRALEINPGFDPIAAPAAKKALQGLGSAP